MGTSGIAMPVRTGSRRAAILAFCVAVTLASLSWLWPAQPYSLQRVVLLSSLLNAALAVVNVRATALAFRERKLLQRRTAQQAMYVELGRQALCGTGLAALMQHAVVELSVVLDVEMCRVLQPSSNQEELRTCAAAGWDTDLAAVPVPLCPESQAGYAWSRNATVVAEDLRGETRFRPSRQLRETRAISGMTVVIRADEEPFGVLCVHSTCRRQFTAEEVNCAQTVADMLGLAVTRQRAEQSLRKFAADLQRSNRELQDFASIASHDLQEPLRKVVAFGDRLRSHCGAQLDETGGDYLARIENAAGRMSLLIEQLLQYSRLSTRTLPFERVDLALTLFSVLSDLEARISQSRAQVTMEPLPVIEADKLQVRQLLQNLVANAIKFHLPGIAPKVHISARVDGDWCELRVRDNGVGFEEQHAERIFRPFQRLHGRNEYEGSGLGLAICRKIATRHGGSINAHSLPGRGSEFVVRLPVHQRPQGATTPPVSNFASPGEDSGAAGPPLA